ncbi:MAG: T9SS type A sorting domain-containing protein [Chlorobi bacterium]|nr:T9SS type A sorting domain-containing protein [Chlorobiota bacterium]
MYVLSYGNDSEIIVNFPDTDDYSLSIYDLQGRLVSLIYSGLIAEGEHRFQIPSKTFTRQVYTIVISNKHETYSHKVIL